MKLYQADMPTKVKLMPGWIQLGVIGLIAYVVYADFSLRQEKLRALEDAKFSDAIRTLVIEPSDCTTPRCPLQLTATNHRGDSKQFPLTNGTTITLPNALVVQVDLPE